VRGGNQFMYVGGVGGTGKTSLLIKAMVNLFENLGKQAELQLSAPTLLYYGYGKVNIGHRNDGAIDSIIIRCQLNKQKNYQRDP
jgi:hypothetical protein